MKNQLSFDFCPLLLFKVVVVSVTEFYYNVDVNLLNIIIMSMLIYTIVLDICLRIRLIIIILIYI